MAFASAMTAASEMRCLWYISNERVVVYILVDLNESFAVKAI